MPRRMEVFFLFALAAHIAFFSMVSIRPNALAFSSIPERIELPEQIEHTPAEEITPQQDDKKKKLERRREQIETLQVDQLVVIPVPASSRARWIVDLIDIPDEEEPEDARFVSERPSRVEEEVRAEETSEEPKPTKKRRKKTIAKKRAVKRRPSKRAVAGRSRTKPKPKPEPATTTSSETETASTSETPPTGIPALDGNGNMPVRRGESDEIRKPITKKNLFPTLGELAQSVAPGGAREPGSDPSGIEGGGDAQTPIAPRAPENFLPMVKQRGQITLLNAKSYKFSGFVRRVAKRIFDRFVVGFEPRRFSGMDYNAMKKGARYEAVMNSSGRTVNVKRFRSSGSSNFDSLIHSAVTKGAWDTNVPEGAECSDGFVHFIFIPKVIPSGPATSLSGSRVYSNFLLLAVAGLKECD